MGGIPFAGSLLSPLLNLSRSSLQGEDGTPSLFIPNTLPVLGTKRNTKP